MLVKRAIGYARVSTRQQGKTDLSIPQQREKIKLYCKLKGLDLLKVVEEVKSAKDLRRPGMQEIIGLARGNYLSDVIVVKLDRLSRRLKDCVELQEEIFQPYGVKLHAVEQSIDTSTPAGRMVLNVMASFCQWEREETCERNKRTIEHLKALGRAYGPLKYGLAREGNKLKTDPDEQHIIRRIKALRRTLSIRKTAARLNREGVLTKQGRRWTRNTVVAASNGVLSCSY